MGQYHKLVNLDKKEFVNPYDLGFGAKQYEQTGVEASIPDAIYLLVMSSPNRGGGDWPLTDVSGRWCGDRVVVLGDYTEDSDIPNYPNASKIYREVSDDDTEWTDITAQVRTAFEQVWNVKYERKVFGHSEMWVLNSVS